MLIWSMALVCAAVLLAGCSGDDTNKPPPIETTAPAATSTALPCPLPQAVCALGGQIEQAVKAKDYDVLVRMSRPITIQCPSPEYQGPPAFPVCQGAAAGESRTGYPVSRRYSEGAVVSAEALRAMISGFVESLNATASDAYGPGSVELYTLGCVEPTPGGPCGRFDYVFSGIRGAGAQAHREVLVFFVQQPAPAQALEVVELRDGIIMPQEEQVVLRGGSVFDLGLLSPKPQAR